MRGSIRLAAAVGLTAAVTALGACSGSSHQGGATPGGTPTASATSSGAASPSGAGSGSASASVTPSASVSAGPVPVYPGATVTSQSTGFTLLHTGDSVSQVGTYYVDTLAREGWQTTSKYQSQVSVNIVARRGHDGVTVQVNPNGSGTAISIASYHV